MAIPAYSLSEIEKLKPCPDRFAVVKALKLGHGKITAKEAVEAGVSLDDLIWVVLAIAKTDADVERRTRLWLADIAAHAVFIFEKKYPTDFRPRNAIIAARQFARGEISGAARDAAGAAEESWQLDRFVCWFSEKDPVDWPLPEPIKAIKAA